LKNLIIPISLFLFCSSITVGQGIFSIGKTAQDVLSSRKKSKQGEDTLNFGRINRAMEPALVVIGQDSFHYKKISSKNLDEICNYPPYNASRKEAYQELSRDLDHLDECISGVANKNSQFFATQLFDLKNTIGNFRKYHPQFDISSYETIYISLQQKQDNEKEQERLAEIERKKREADYEKTQDSLKEVAVKQQKEAALASSKDDIYDSTTMMTVEEYGQEYERSLLWLSQGTLPA